MKKEPENNIEELKSELFHLQEFNKILQNQNFVLNEIINSPAEPIFSLDKNYCYTSFNISHKNVMKVLYNKDIQLRKPIYEYQIKTDWEKAKKNIDRALNGETVSEEAYSGEEATRLFFIVSHYPMKNEKNEIVGVTIFAKEITLRKKAEKALKESEQKYHNVLENAGETIVVAQDGFLKFFNKSAVKLLNRTSEEIITLPFPTFIYPDDRDLVTNNYKRRISGEKLEEIYEFRILQPNGTVRWVEINAVLIDWEGRPATLNFISDITERKKIEEEKSKLQLQLLQSHKMEAIGTLAGGIAHDFNNLLTIIMGNAKLAAEAVDKTSTVAQDLNEISLTAARGATLVRQLLLYSSKQPMGFCSLNINSTINNILKMLKRLIGEDINIKLELDPGIEIIKVDESNIEQAIINICINARDAMPNGGTITIKSENVVLSEAQSKKNEESHPGVYVRLSITDTGIGMDKETVKHIFEPFFTTKGIGKGTGLGLSVVYGIVKAHNGWINVNSELSHGTVFNIYLPAEKTNGIAKSENQVEPKSLKGHGENILVIEDEQGVLAYTKRLLIGNGYWVFTATNSEEAIEIFKNNSKNIDLIISDMILPDKNGLETIKQLRLLKNDVPVIFISGYLDDKSRYSEMQEKGYSYIKKPYEMDELFKLLRELLEK